MSFTAPRYWLSNFSSALLAGQISEAIEHRNQLIYSIDKDSPFESIDAFTRDRFLLECTKSYPSGVVLEYINNIRFRVSLPVLCDRVGFLVSSILSPYYRDEDSPSDISLRHLCSNDYTHIQSIKDSHLASLVSDKNLLLIGPCHVDNGTIVQLIKDYKIDVVLFFSLYSSTDLPRCLQDILPTSCSIISYLNGVKANHLEAMAERLPCDLVGSIPIYYQLRRWSWLTASRRFRPIYLADIPLSLNGGLQLTNAVHDLIRYQFNVLHVVGCHMYSSGNLYSKDYLGYSRPDPQSFALPTEDLLKRLLDLHDPLGDFRFLQAILRCDERIRFDFNFIDPRTMSDTQYLYNLLSSYCSTNVR